MCSVKIHGNRLCNVFFAVHARNVLEYTYIYIYNMCVSIFMRRHAYVNICTDTRLCNMYTLDYLSMIVHG